LAGVYGRKPGSIANFRYSPGYDKADFSWDETHLDLYLTDPQAVIPGSMMLYKRGVGISRLSDLAASWREQFRQLGIATPRRIDTSIARTATVGKIDLCGPP
jgi:hypothetical protein